VKPSRYRLISRTYMFHCPSEMIQAAAEIRLTIIQQRGNQLSSSFLRARGMKLSVVSMSAYIKACNCVLFIKFCSSRCCSCCGVCVCVSDGTLNKSLPCYSKKSAAHNIKCERGVCACVLKMRISGGHNGKQQCARCKKRRLAHQPDM
jgi:hypothetical protein